MKMGLLLYVMTIMSLWRKYSLNKLLASVWKLIMSNKEKDIFKRRLRYRRGKLKWGKLPLKTDGQLINKELWDYLICHK